MWVLIICSGEYHQKTEKRRKGKWWWWLDFIFTHLVFWHGFFDVIFVCVGKSWREFYASTFPLNMETVLKWTFVMTFVLLYALRLTYFKSFVPFHVERLARSIVFGLLIQARPCTPSWFFGKWHLRRCLSASNWTFEDLSSTGEEKYSVSDFLENRRTRIDVTTNCCFAGAIQEGRITCIDMTKNAVSKTGGGGGYCQGWAI